MRTLLLAMLLVLNAGCASMTVVRVPVTCTNGAPPTQSDVGHEHPGLLQRLRDAMHPDKAPQTPRHRTARPR